VQVRRYDCAQISRLLFVNATDQLRM